MGATIDINDPVRSHKAAALPMPAPVEQWQPEETSLEVAFGSASDASVAAVARPRERDAAD